MAHANVGHPVYDYSTALVPRSLARGGTGLSPCGELVESAAVPLLIFTIHICATEGPQLDERL